MARRSVNCDLLFCQWGGVRAKQRNVAITEKVMIFLGSKPGPSLFNFSNYFVTLNLFWLLSSARVGAAFELALRRICDWPLFNSLRDWLVLVRGPALRSIWSLREGRGPGKKIEDPTDRIEWASWSRSSGRIDLPRTESHQFESLRGSTFWGWTSIAVSEKFLIELIKFSIFQGKIRFSPINWCRLDLPLSLDLSRDLILYRVLFRSIKAVS